MNQREKNVRALLAKLKEREAAGEVHIPYYDGPPLFPDKDWPRYADVKRIGAKCGRAKTQADEDKWRGKLREVMREMDMGGLNYWATVVMLDHRFQGATGLGAFWAVASRIVNEVAREVLRTRPMFQIIE